MNTFRHRLFHFCCLWAWGAVLSHAEAPPETLLMRFNGSEINNYGGGVETFSLGGKPERSYPWMLRLDFSARGAWPDKDDRACRIYSGTTPIHPHRDYAVFGAAIELTPDGQTPLDLSDATMIQFDARVEGEKSYRAWRIRLDDADDARRNDNAALAIAKLTDEFQSYMFPIADLLDAEGDKPDLSRATHLVFFGEAGPPGSEPIEVNLVLDNIRIDFAKATEEKKPILAEDAATTPTAKRP